MLDTLHIENFKSIGKQSFKLRPLTILTGLNSTGKSTVIQSILLLSAFYTQTQRDTLKTQVAHYYDFNVIRNKYKNAKFVKIIAHAQDDEFYLEMDYDENYAPSKTTKPLDYEHNLYYISANRIGQEVFATLSKEQKLGSNGEYVFGYFEQNKDKLLNQSLIKFEAAGHTLKAQVNEWLQYILELPITLEIEKISPTNVKISFSSDEIDDINPFNLGAGNSYLVKILIVALMCEQDDLLLIENPEIHLHPKAQARLGEFFAWMANAHIQIILETHSEHLINKLKYQIYKEALSKNDAIIYYKPSIKQDFVSLAINEDGKFIDEDENIIQFPSGFFDSTLEELLEIG